MTDSTEENSKKDITEEIKSSAHRPIPRPKYQQPPKFPLRKSNNNNQDNNDPQNSENDDVKMDIPFSQFDKQPKISAIRRSTPQPGQYHLDLRALGNSSSSEFATNADNENRSIDPTGSGVQLDIDFQKFDDQGPTIRLPTPRPGQTVGPGGVKDEDYCHYNPPNNDIEPNDSPEEDYENVRIEIPLFTEEQSEDDVNNIQIDANQINDEIPDDVKFDMDFGQFDGESCDNRMATPRPDKENQNNEEHSIGEEEEEEADENLGNIRIEITHDFEEPNTPSNSVFTGFDISQRQDRVSTPPPHAHREVFNEEMAEVKLLKPLHNSDEEDDAEVENIRIVISKENDITPTPVSQFDTSKRPDRVSTPRPHINNAQIDLNSIEFAEEEEEPTPKATNQPKSEAHPPMPKRSKVPNMPKILQTKKFPAPIPKPISPTIPSGGFSGDEPTLDTNNRQDRMSTPRPVKSGKKNPQSNPLHLPTPDIDDNDIQMNIDFAQFDGSGCALRMATPRPSRNPSKSDIYKVSEEEEEEAEDPVEISPMRNFKFPINDEIEPLVVHPLPAPAAHQSTPRPGRSCVREAFKDAELAEGENAEEYMNEEPLDDLEPQINIDYSQFEPTPGEEMPAMRRATPRPSKQRLVVEENAPQSSSSDDEENESKELTPNRSGKKYSLPKIPIGQPLSTHNETETKADSPKSSPSKYNLPLLNFGPMSNITKDNKPDEK